MENKLVSNIKPMLLIRLLSGHYHDVAPSKQIRLFFKVYCLFVAALVTWMNYELTAVIHTYSVAACNIEYICYILFSLIIKDEYMIKYYTHIKHVDGIPRGGSYPYLGLIFSLYFVLTCSLELLLNAATCFLYRKVCFKFYMMYIYDFVVCVMSVIGRLPLLMVISLTYCRVRRMLEELKTDKLLVRGKFQPRKYVHMYQTIMDALDESNYYVQKLLYIFLLTSNIKITADVYYIVRGIKSNKLKTPIATCFTLRVLLNYNSIIITSILCDLIDENIKLIKIIILEKRINATNERERAEIQKLFQLLQNRPFEYTLGRIATLSFRTVLIFISFVTTTVISLLQIIDLHN